jgi:hypothetical protein
VAERLNVRFDMDWTMRRIGGLLLIGILMLSVAGFGCGGEDDEGAASSQETGGEDSEAVPDTIELTLSQVVRESVTPGVPPIDCTTGNDRVFDLHVLRYGVLVGA